MVTIHDLSPIDHPEWNTPRFAAWYAFLLPKLARTARRVITDSQFSRDRILEITGLDPDRVVTIPIGVDKRFRPIGVVSNHSRIGKLGLPSAQFLLAVGANSPRKNVQRLLEAWQQAMPDLPDDMWLVIAGSLATDHMFAHDGLDRAVERVHFTGAVSDDDLPVLYANALALVFPSLYEGFGLPPLEAMASGTPVIASNRASLPEVVGPAGLLVDPTSVSDIAAAMVT